MKIVDRVVQQSVPSVIRVACVLALAGLCLMVLSVLWPRPLVVIGAMSIGHGLGIGAFLCYLLGVLLDTARRARAIARHGDAANSVTRE